MSEYAQQTSTLTSQLMRCGTERLRIELARRPAEAPDVWLWVVGKANIEAAGSELHELRRAYGVRPVIAITIGLSVTEITQLLRAGVSDFIAFPFDHEECEVRIQRAAASALHFPAADVREVLSPVVRDIVGTNATFMRQLALLPTIAGCNAGVLILGETGTGKEVFAQAIHYLSSRASKPWVAVNCAGIPTELIESELFGHVKGAFTNAVQARTGLIREAEGGTLFLDEIDSLPYGSQAKLLRFLQDKAYRPVGSSKQLVADVRVLAASNNDLPKLVAAATFRQDLFFRLNVLSITLPALRERRDDIPALVLHFLRKACEAANRPLLGISPAVLAQWLAYDWPGNVRELRHAVERAVLFADPAVQCIQVADQAASPTEELRESSFRHAKARVISDFERNYLEAVLRSCSGNITHAAVLAGKNRRAFFELLRKHQIQAQRFR